MLPFKQRRAQARVPPRTRSAATGLPVARFRRSLHLGRSFHLGRRQRRKMRNARRRRALRRQEELAATENQERERERNDVIEQPEQQQTGQQLLLVELP